MLDKRKRVRIYVCTVVRTIVTTHKRTSEKGERHEKAGNPTGKIAERGKRCLKPESLSSVFCVLPFRLHHAGSKEKGSPEMIRNTAFGKSCFVTANGIKRHYVELSGPGEKVLLVHGFGSSIHTWKEVARYLHDLGFHVFALDLVGFGQSEKPKDASYDALSLMEGVVEWMDAVGLKSAVVAGNSLGGGIAALLSIIYPERVRGLVLINALVPYDIPYPWVLKLARLPLACHLARFVVSRKIVKQTLEQVFYDPELVTDARVEAYYAPLKTAGAMQAQVRVAKALEPGPYLKYLANGKTFEAPCMVIWGAEDRWIPLEFGLSLADSGKEGDELAVIPGCGHMPQEEKPLETARLMEKFLISSDFDIETFDPAADWKQCG